MAEPVASLLDSPQLQRYGLPEYVQAASPAAGANFTRTIEGNYIERLVSVFCRLVTDANAANRTLRLEYLDAEGNVYDVMGNPVTYPASQTEDFSFSAFQGQGEWEVAAANLVPLHPVLLPPTHSFRLLVSSIQATDALTRIRFVRERFYTESAPPGIPR